MTDIMTLQNLLSELRLKGMQMALETLLEKANKQGISIQEFLHEMLLQEKKFKQERSISTVLIKQNFPLNGVWIPFLSISNQALIKHK